MDIKLPKKPWYVRYRLYLLGGIVLVALIGYVIALQLQPKTLRVSIDADQLQLILFYVRLALADLALDRLIGLTRSCRVAGIDNSSIHYSIVLSISPLSG